MTALATDNFNRANVDPIGGNWTTISTEGDLAIVSNAVTPHSLAVDSGAFYNAITWPNDQYSQLNLTVSSTTSAQGMGPAVRVASAAETYYRVVLSHAATLNVVLHKVVASSLSTLWSRTATFNDGDLVRLEVQGTTLRVFIAGTQVGADFSDSSSPITSGSAGIGYSPAATSNSGDNWEGGDLVTSIPYIDPITHIPPYMLEMLIVGQTDLFAGNQSAAGPDQTTFPFGISTAEVFGNPSVAPAVTPTGIPTAEAFGNITTSYVVTPFGIPTAEAFGQPTISLLVTPFGISTSEQFGNPTVAPSINPFGIPTSEQFGNPTTSLFVTPFGIPTAEQFGNPSVFTAVTVTAYGIPTNEVFGNPTVTQVVLPYGIPTNEAFGQPTISLFVTPYGIPTAERFGNPTIIASVNPTGIPSSEAFGSPAVTLFVTPYGISTQERLGNPTIFTAVTINPYGIVTAEAFGNPVVTPGAVTITPFGISSQQALGNPSVAAGLLPGSIQAYGIASSEAVGQPFVGYQVQIDFDWINSPFIIIFRLDPTVTSQQDGQITYHQDPSIVYEQDGIVG